LIPNSVTTIGDSAFEGCVGLTSVIIPSSISNIELSAFDNCTSLTSVYFEGNAPAVEVAFSGDKTTLYYMGGTAGWSSPFADLPAVLWTPQMQTGDASLGVRTNQFGFTIRWASGTTVVVDACTSVAKPIWSPVATNTLINASSYLSDPQWTKYRARFYRLRSL
jgi:hypothetical protein